MKLITILYLRINLITPCMQSFNTTSQFNNLIIIKSKKKQDKMIHHYDTNIISISQPTLANLQEYLPDNNCLYINLREEPIIYINHLPFVLRSKNAPYINLLHYKNINKENLQINEENIKHAIKSESLTNGGSIYVYDIELYPIIKRQLMLIDSVYTVKDIFSTYFTGVEYHRIPISTFECGLENNSIDNLIDLFKNFDISKKLVLNSEDNRSRTVYAYLIFCLVKKLNVYTKKNLRDSTNYFMENIEDKGIRKNLLNTVLNGNFRIVTNLLYILDTKKAKIIVDNHIESIDLKLDMRYLLIKKFYSNKKKHTNDSENPKVKLLKRYIMLIIISNYLLGSSNTTFKDYFVHKYEFVNLFRYVDKCQKKDDLLFPLNFISADCCYLDSKTLQGIYTVLIKQEMCGSKMYNRNMVESNLKLKNTIFINLREEPVIYIDNVAHALRDFQKYSKNITFLRICSVEKLERLENKIKTNICKELQLSTFIHVNEINNGVLCEKSLKDINESMVCTSKEYFAKKHSGIYFRIPITSSVSFRFSLFDKILKIADEMNLHNDKHTQIELFASSKKGRSAYIQMIFDVIMNISITTDKNGTYKNEIFMILNKLLEHGEQSFNDGCHLFYKYFKISFANFVNIEQHIKKQIRTIKKFFIIICFIDYYRHNSKNERFEQWIMNRNDIYYLYNQINELYKSQQTSSNANINKEVIDRTGEVLTGKMILKNDYFIGSNIFNEFIHISGTRNFRLIVSGKNDIFIGLAMPINKGIKNTIKEIERHVSSRINWFCLREEPVIFINERPYVLRNIEKDYENLVIRGVTTEIIEKIEEKLRKDIVKHEKIILHTEVEIDNKLNTISFETAPSDVKSIKEVLTYYNKVDYHRIPMTDERIPLPATIDKLVNQLKKLSGNKVLVFNCQVGRGRTTTGLVISYLFYNYKDIYGRFYEPDAKIINSLLHILPNAIRSKSVLDEVIDTLDHCENLRGTYVNFLESNPEKARNYLLRYLYLICFAEFLFQDKDNSFVEFIRNRNEIQNLLDHIKLNDLSDII